MPLTLEAFAARLPELGTPSRHAFLLLEVAGRRDVPVIRHTDQAPVCTDSGRETRAPLCIALALDASSSMRGPRFALAVQAARDLIDSLHPEDRVALVTFDRSARFVLGAIAGDEEGKSHARRALDRLSTGRGTNIAAGWREAAEALLRLVVPGSARRVFVLTDGVPSCGDTEPDALRRLVAEGHDRGVETSVIGIGDGIDDKLCALLARAGDGRFHYLRDEGLLGDVIANEIEGTKRLAALEVSLILALSQRVLRAEVLHRYACQPGGRTLEVRVGAVSYDVPRAVLLQMEVDDPQSDAMLGVALARGRALAPFQRRRTGTVTTEGYALGARPLEVLDDASEVSSGRLSLTLPPGQGALEIRKRIAREVVLLRTLAEVRSAWDAYDACDRDAVRRRLGRARELRRVLLEAGLLDATCLAELPDVEVIEAAMLGGGAEMREARRAFSSWAHNTQVSLVLNSRIKGPGRN